MKEPLILVVGMNLRFEEIKDEMIVANLEGAFAYVLSYFYYDNIDAENQLLFSFPFDPSVKSDSIPVVFRVTLLPSIGGLLSRIGEEQPVNEFSEKLHKTLRSVLPNRSKIIIILEDLSKTASTFLPT